MFDNTYTNVALMKPTTSSATGAAFSASMGVDGVIDYDDYSTTTNLGQGNLMSSAACDGSAWWQVDLGGIYNISAIMVWNNEPLTLCTSNTCAAAQVLAGATLSLLNYAGTGVLNVTGLSGIGVETIFAPKTYPPTATATSSATATPTPSSTPSVTPSPSSSVSFGDSPTSTMTQTPSPSVTPSATQTQTPTPSPLSTWPYMARIATSGTGQCLNFVEVRREVAGRNARGS